MTFCFQVLATSVLRSEVLKLRKSDMLCQITKTVSESKWKNRQTELSSRKGERNRMIGGKIGKMHKSERLNKYSSVIRWV